jgi:hypothetical protein
MADPTPGTVPVEADLFRKYANKNVELRMLAYKAFEYGRNAAYEQSAGMSIGIDEHAIARQTRYVDDFNDRLNSIYARPVPDLPHIHPTRFDIDLSERYQEFTKDGLVINEDTELLAAYWLAVAVTLASSQSAGAGGSLIDADYNRVKEQIAVISKFLVECAKRPIPDIPETAYPATALGLKATVGAVK